MRHKSMEKFLTGTITQIFFFNQDLKPKRLRNTGLGGNFISRPHLPSMYVVCKELFHLPLRV